MWQYSTFDDIHNINININIHYEFKNVVSISFIYVTEDGPCIMVFFLVFSFIF